MEFIPLREEAERRGRLIKAASDRQAPPDEACKLISDFEQAEVRMIKYVEVHTQSCAISEQVAYQLGSGHENTVRLMKKVCAAAERMRQGLSSEGIGPAGLSPARNPRVWPPKGPTGDFDTFR